MEIIGIMDFLLLLLSRFRNMTTLALMFWARLSSPLSQSKMCQRWPMCWSLLSFPPFQIWKISPENTHVPHLFQFPKNKETILA
jgi:hypothetical protein